MINKPRAFVDYVSDLKLTKEQFSHELELYIEKQEKRFQNVIANVKALLEKEKVSNRKLRHEQAKRLGTASTKSEMLTYFSGVVPEKSPSNVNIEQSKFPSNRVIKNRGKSQGGSRKTRFRSSMNKQSKLILRPPTAKV